MKRKSIKAKRSLAIAIVAVMVLAGCSGKKETSSSVSNSTPPASQGGNTTPSGSGTAIRDINVNNWSAVIKDNFGIDLTLPSGWTVKEATSPNNRSNIKVFFNTGGSVTSEDFARTIFETTKAASPRDLVRNDNVCNSFADAVTSNGIATWRYYREATNAYYIVNAYYESGTLEITLQG